MFGMFPSDNGGGPFGLLGWVVSALLLAGLALLLLPVGGGLIVIGLLAVVLVPIWLWCKGAWRDWVDGGVRPDDGAGSSRPSDSGPSNASGPFRARSGRSWMRWKGRDVEVEDAQERD